MLPYVSLTGAGFRGVHGDNFKEVRIENTKEEQEGGEESICGDLVEEVPIDKCTTTAVTQEGSVVTVLAVEPEAKSPFQRYVVPAECYNSTWMLNADPNSKLPFEYFGYDPTTDNGTDLYLSCRSYLRVPRKYFPELSVTRKRGRSVEGGEEDHHGNKTAGPQKPRNKDKGKVKKPNKSGNSK